MKKESPAEDAMEGRTFPCPHCGFMLQKAWQQKRCPWCEREIPPDAANLEITKNFNGI